MLGYQAQSYQTACGTLSGGISELFWFDPEDINFTQAAATASVLLQPYTALALRAGATVATGGGLFPIGIEEETGTFKATQTISGRSVKWDYEIVGELAKMSNSLTNFMARLDAASVCSNIGLVIVDMTGTIHVVGERYVNASIIPKFKMKNDGSVIELGAAIDGKNGGTLSLKGVYSRGPLEYTGGRESLDAFIEGATTP